MADTKLPTCIGIILDGNRRWAREQGLSTFAGHKEGLETLVRTARWVRDRGIPHLVVFAFSSENWNRSEEEVSYLMDLIKRGAEERLGELSKERVRVRFIGDRARLAPDVRAAIARVEEESESNEALTLWVCLSYGGRAEILAAAQETGGNVNSEEDFKAAMWSADMPDPDIIVRTGGEQRLSNFLLWQAAYAELFFVPPFWPDFSETTLDDILNAYGTRERRHGK